MPIKIQVGILGDESLRRWPVWCHTNGTHTIQQLRGQVNNRLSGLDDQHKKSVNYRNNEPTTNDIRLFFNGQELLDHYTIEEYGLQNDNVILAMVNHTDLAPEVSFKEHDPPSECDQKKPSPDLESLNIKQDDYYSVGDHVDAYDLEQTGAWFPAKIVAIQKEGVTVESDAAAIESSSGNDYFVSFDKPSLGYRVQRKLFHIRPQSTERLSFDQLELAQSVLIELTPGHWFVAVIERILLDCRTRISSGKVWLNVIGSGGAGAGKDGNSGPLLAQHIVRIPKQDIRKLRSNVLRSERPELLNCLIESGQNISNTEPSRYFEPDCVHCNDNPTNDQCPDCGCQVCSLKSGPDKQLVCDECDRPTHFWCLRNPITELSSQEEWFCDQCRNQSQQEVVSLQKRYLENKRKQMALSDEYSYETRSDKRPAWGFGMACARRTEEPQENQKNLKSTLSATFGPIPKVPVGSWWRFRVQASEVSVHAPLVAGIHGRESCGAFSVVFSGVYQDDVDLGDNVYYTASGGRESNQKGKKQCRSGRQQITDQKLTRCNKALAVNCWAPFNAETGASSGENWRQGKPIRLLRSGNGRHSAERSPYLPKIGVRYDGIYKVVKYWTEIGQSGYKIWRFHLRRDDPSPAPWTPAGRYQARKLGLQLPLYPPDWSQDIAAKRCWKVDRKYLIKQQKQGQQSKKRKNNREQESKTRTSKKPEKIFHFSEKIQDLIQLDWKNSKLWSELVEVAKQNGKEKFHQQLSRSLVCVCCLETIEPEKNPVTTDCGHNFCRQCLCDAVQLTKLNQCPSCRTKLISPIQDNKTLQQILVQLSEARSCCLTII